MTRRRNVLLYLLFVFITFVFGMSVWDGNFLRSYYDSSKDYYDHEKEMMSETQFQLIKAGIQAGSSHNMQPWKIRIHDQKSFSLHADMEKTLPVIDPQNKQLLMSQGTFIGLVKKAAEEADVELQVTYHALNMSENFPLIATFTILQDKNSKIDAVTSATRGTFSEDTAFDLEKATDSIYNQLPGYEVVWIEGEKLGRFQYYLKKGSSIEAENQQAMEELLDIFRFTKWEKNKYRYGLSLNTISPPVRTMIEPIVGVTSGWKSFGHSSMATFFKRLDGEKSYLVLSVRNPQLSDYIQVGEAFSMLSLNMEGYASRPAVQLLQPLSGMQEVYNDMQEEFDIKGEVMMIIGFTKITDSYHESVRHQVSDLIMNKNSY